MNQNKINASELYFKEIQSFRFLFFVENTLFDRSIFTQFLRVKMPIQFLRAFY